MRVAVLTLALVVTSSSLAALAPSPHWRVGAAQTPQTPIFRGGVEVIEVDVSVVDDRGRPMTDLLGPEFTVTVDGKPRKVVAAEYVTLRPAGELRTTGTNSARTSRTEVARAEAPYSSNVTNERGRLIILAVDRDSISFGEGRQAMAAAIRFLDRLGPNDKVAFITVPPTDANSVDFTSNHQLVRKALERMVGFAHRPRQMLNIGVYEALAIDQHSDPQTEAVVMTRFCGQTVASLVEQCQLDVRAQASAISAEIHQRVDASLRSLRSVLEALREVDGPKSLVWISEGLVVEGPGSELTDIGRLAAAARTTVNVMMLDAPLVDVSEREKSPTGKEDRDLEERGLDLLAGLTRGALFRVSVNADYVFERIENEISGYYLLAVESALPDRDGKRHMIKVEVRRRGANVRARREFQSEAQRKAETTDERLARTLRSPFAIAELPLRLATYAYQDAATSKIRVIVATEIEPEKGAEKTAAPVTIGLVLLDAGGQPVINSIQRPTLTPVDGPRGPLLEHAGALMVEPGTYTLKLAAIDQAGRRGSIEHRLTAWQMTGVPFALSDLMLADSPTKAGDTLQPAVEARLATGRLAAYLELYADHSDFFGTATVTVEVAAGESAPALASSPGQLQPAGSGNTRSVSALVPVETLPPGSYVARAIVTRGDQKIGQLLRPFQITASAAALSRPALIGAMLPAPPAFERAAAMKAEVLAFFMDVLDKGRPALKATTMQVRSGRLDGAARQAFEADDQLAAAFLRGLELLAKGDLNQAATQFSGALRIAPDFAPASFYLGVCYAVAGRDRDAVIAWRRALVGQDKLPLGYTILSDALVRAGDASQAVAPLREALAAWPDDDAIRRRLAIAQAVALQHGEALAVIEPYLTRHGADHEALLVALHAIYAAHLGGRTLVGADQDRERMATYARAYSAARGPHDTLVTAWAAFVAKR